MMNVSGQLTQARAVIFDIDNTLYSYDDAHAAAFTDLCEFVRSALDIAPEPFARLHRSTMDIQRRYAGSACAAIHNRLIRFQFILEQLHKPVSLAPEMSARYWNAFLKNIHPAPGLSECLETLRKRSLMIGIGTNMTADYQYEKLRCLNVLEQIDFIVTSEEINAEKPDRKLFDRCAEKAGCTPGECVFVGDNPEDDIKGALNAGMSAVWYVPEMEKPSGIAAQSSPSVSEGLDIPVSVPRIATLAELPELLSRPLTQVTLY